MVLDQDNAPFRLIITSMMNHSIRNCVIFQSNLKLIACNYAKNISKNCKLCN